jgi:hypothetical protein
MIFGERLLRIVFSLNFFYQNPLSMSLIKNILRPKQQSIRSYESFWNWFEKNEKTFFKSVRNGGQIEKDFFRKLGPKLNELKEGFYYLTGMYDDDTAELIISPEGVVKNIVFTEELVRSAPPIKGWRFTALKPEMGIEDVNIQMAGFKFNNDKMNFIPVNNPAYPDEIDITIVHDDLTEENKSTILNGTYIFLDNFLGELNFVTTIDNLDVIAKGETQRELVPMAKLKEYLVWREKEFVEKYEGTRYNTENDSYAAMEAELKNGMPLVAVINTELLKWDRKASHPWMMNIELKYDGSADNGMPNEADYQLMEEIENKIQDQLKDSDGYLNIGRETADSLREVFFACREFRKPSKVLHQIQSDYANRIEMSFEIHKDKYWRTLDRVHKG